MEQDGLGGVQAILGLVDDDGPGAVQHLVADEVLDGPWSVVIDEAENRLHTAKAVLIKLLAAPKKTAAPRRQAP